MEKGICLSVSQSVWLSALLLSVYGSICQPVCLILFPSACLCVTIWLPFCLSVYVPVYLSSVRVSAWLSTPLLVCMYMSIFVTLCPSACLSVFTCMPFCLSVVLSTGLSVCLHYIFLSTCLCVYLLASLPAVRLSIYLFTSISVRLARHVINRSFYFQFKSSTNSIICQPGI